MDRLSATEQRCGEVESAIFDLFAQLGASEEQLDFPVLYASAREVFALSPLEPCHPKPFLSAPVPLVTNLVTAAHVRCIDSTCLEATIKV